MRDGWIDERLKSELWRICQEDWRAKNVRDVVSVCDTDVVYVRCKRWRRYVDDGRHSKLTGRG